MKIFNYLTRRPAACPRDPVSVLTLSGSRGQAAGRRGTAIKLRSFPYLVLLPASLRAKRGNPESWENLDCRASLAMTPVGKNVKFLNLMAVERRSKRQAVTTILFIAGLLLFMNIIYAESSRNPFLKSQMASSSENIVDDLSSYSISVLTLVGVIQQADLAMAMVRDPKNHIYPLKIGDMIGSEHAMITKIMDKEIWVEWSTAQQVKLTQVLTIS